MKKLSIILLPIILTLTIALVLLLTNNANAETVRTSTLAVQTLAEETAAVDNTTGLKAISAGIAIGVAALGGAIAMGMAISKASEGISRQPEADGKIRSTLMLGLVFIETLVIYALIIGILIIFVL